MLRVLPHAQNGVNNEAALDGLPAPTPTKQTEIFTK